MSSILFSVIIPTYKRRIKLQRAINSVLSQTYKNWEILVIDNFSEDGTNEMIKNYCNNKIKILHIKNNGCIAKSRNLGVKKAKGKFIAFLDSDDYWFKDKLNCCNQVLIKNKEAKFIYHNMYINNKIFNFISKSISYFRQVKLPVYEDLIINGSAFPTSSVVLDKKIFKRINMFDTNKNLITWEDYDAWIRFSKISNNFICINKILGVYTYDNENTLNNKRQILNINSFRKKYFIREYKKKGSWCYYALFISYFKEKKYKSALNFFFKINLKNLKNLDKIKLLICFLVLRLNLNLLRLKFNKARFIF